MSKKRLHTFLEMFLCRLNKLKRDQLEATLLEPGDDFTDEVALNAVRLWRASAIWWTWIKFEDCILPWSWCRCAHWQTLWRIQERGEDFRYFDLHISATPSKYKHTVSKYKHTRYTRQAQLAYLMFGPLGFSLAPYVNSSRTLSRWISPIANWYANASGYRKYGFKYDDLCM